MKKVLLTGATGFIGRHCVAPLLEKGYEIHAVSSKNPAPNRQDIHWHRADLLDSGAVQEVMARVSPAHLLLFAWGAERGTFWNSPENLRWVQAGIDLFRAFAREGGNRAVGVGTCAEYDWRYGYCSEMTTPLVPATLYGTCKHSLQFILRTFAAMSGIGFSWGRVFFTYGPFEPPDRLVPSVIQSILEGRPAPCSRGHQIRDYLHVQDVADAFVALLESDSVGPVNIASGIPVAVKDIACKIAEIMHRPDLVRMGIVPVPANDPPFLVADVSHRIKSIDWSPKYDLDRGIEETIQWWSTRRSMMKDSHPEISLER